METGRPRWPQAVSANWFVLLVVASGFLTLVQALSGLSQLPLQIAGRALLVGQVVLASFAVTKRARPMPEPLLAPLLLFFGSATTSFVASLWTQRSDAVSSFLFMYSVGILLILFLVTPITVSASRTFKLFCAASCGFGIAQSLRQDLLLPPAVIEKFGIVYTLFVNGHVRALSFFASAPRFAELMVVCALYVQHGLVTRRTRNPAWLLAYAAILYALYNTFSRSGYILFFLSFLVQLALIRSEHRRSSASSRGPRLFLALSVPVTAAILVLVGTIRVDSTVADSTSFSERQSHWSDLVAQLRAGGVADILIGNGSSAHYTILSSNYFVVDNLFLSIFLYSGLLGLFAFGFLYVRLTKQALRASRSGETAGWFPVLSFFVCLPIEGLFLDNHNTVFVSMFAICGLLASQRLREASAAASSGAIPAPQVAAHPSTPPLRGSR